MSEPSRTRADLPPIPAKRYFTIGEVSDLCAVKPHVLRYWEQEFVAAEAGQATRQPALLPAPRGAADPADPRPPLRAGLHDQRRAPPPRARCPRKPAPPRRGPRRRPPSVPARPPAGAQARHPRPLPPCGRNWPKSASCSISVDADRHRTMAPRPGIMSSFGRGVAQPGSAPAWGAGGRKFESSRPDHFSPSSSAGQARAVPFRAAVAGASRQRTSRPRPGRRPKDAPGGFRRNDSCLTSPSVAPPREGPPMTPPAPLRSHRPAPCPSSRSPARNATRS